MEDLPLFTRHVGGAMQSKAPLHEILRAFVLDNERGPLSSAIGIIADEVEQGVLLSKAMEQFPRYFPASYLRLVRLGEESKSLGSIMNQLTDNLEQGLKPF
jgi:general secretion pathway protein F